MNLAGALLALLASTAPTPPAGFARTRLDNGLTVLVQEDRRAPLVAVGIMYAVGARNEAAGLTGVAHYVEHMNFRASARFPGSENTEAITRLGGRWNGYTWIDQTYYAATVPRDALGLVLDIEKDRMTSSVFDPRDFDRERRSVIAELHSYDDPQSLLYDAVVAASFELHPYRHNTIGWLSDVEQLTREEAFRFYRRFYHPGNAVLAIVGDVDAALALEEVRRRFGAVPAAGETTGVRTVEPEQTGQRRVTVRRPGPHAQLIAAWRAPALGDADFPAMVLFDALLAGGKGFYFTREYPAPPRTPLERALAGASTDAGSDWQASRYPYVYTLRASVAEAAGLEAAEKALLRAVDEAAAREWTAAELSAARRQVRAGWAADLDDLAGRAHQLAFFEVSGGAEWLDALPGRLEQVTPDELREFARGRLRPERATIGRFVPTDEPAKRPPAASPAERPSRAALPAAVPPASAAPLGAPIVPSSRASSRALASGARVNLVPRPGARLFALEARLNVGAPADARAGALNALLTERLARPVAGEEPSSVVLSFALHDDPAEIANLRWLRVKARGLADDLPSVLGLLGTRLQGASRPIDKEEWTALMEAAHERAREHTASSATAMWARALAELYPAGSPLSRPPWGEVSAFETVRAEDLRAFAGARLQPARLEIALSGAFDDTVVHAVLERTLGRWKGGSGAKSVAPPPPPRGPAQWTERSMTWSGKAQNDILVVWPGERRAPADQAATRALLYLLGETGYAGRLGRALVEPGLAYSVYATLEEAPGAPGFLAVRTAASRADTREALRRIRETLEAAARGAFIQAELDEARSYLRGREALRREGSEDAARAALEDAAEPQRFDPQSLTLAQLNSTARRLFARGAPLAIVLGPGME